MSVFIRREIEQSPGHGGRGGASGQGRSFWISARTASGVDGLGRSATVGEGGIFLATSAAGIDVCTRMGIIDVVLIICSRLKASKPPPPGIVMSRTIRSG